MTDPLPPTDPVPNPDLPAYVPSPRWGSNIKLIVGLTIVGLILALMIYFRNIIGPLLLSFILAVLIQPLAAKFSQSARISWRLSVNLIFLVLLVVIISVLTVSGLALVQQAQSAFAYLEDFINTLPDMLNQLSRQVISIGPFTFDFSRLDLGALARQGLEVVRPLLGEAGNLLGTLASGTINALGWLLFILLVAYFLLSESGRFLEDLVHIEIPGYTADIQRLIRQLVNTWYAFLRGQVIVSLLIFAVYYIMMTLLGTRLSLVIAILAGIAAFIPYIGPFFVWMLTFIISYLQVDNYLGLAPILYASLVLACCLLLNQIFDYLITPRIMGNTLGVHPAGVLIAAIIFTDLLGFVGLILAAPVLATLSILGRYVSRKMLDLDPWAGEGYQGRTIPARWSRLDKRLESTIRWLRSKMVANK